MKNAKPVVCRHVQSLRSRLALSTALATVAFFYGGRAAYAGACVQNGPVGTYLCSGAEDISDVTQNLTGGPLTVSTVDPSVSPPGFGLLSYFTKGNSFTLTGTGGISFTDNYASPITSYLRGVEAKNSVSGALSVTTTGLVRAFNGDGVYALNNAGTTDLTVSATEITGAVKGIIARNFGSGAISVTTTGQITGTTDDGIFARNYNGTGLTISAVDVSGNGFAANGITGVNTSGALSIATTGTVTGGNYGSGIITTNNGTDLTISVVSATGGSNGVFASNYGSGTTTITASGVVAGTGYSGRGISTRNVAGGLTNITLNSGAAVSGNTYAIADYDGNSTITVNAGASVAGVITLGGGSDDLIFDGGDFSAVTQFDGGTDSDSLTFRNVTGTVASSSITGMESTVIGTGATLSFSDNQTPGNVTVTNGGTLNSLAGATLVNSGALDISNGGTLGLRTGSLFDNSAGTVNNNAGGVIDAEIDLALAGTVNLNSGSTLNSSAILTNQIGRIQANSGAIVNQTGGTLLNLGTIDNQSGGSLTNQSGGSLLNIGTLSTQAGATLTNEGTLNNNNTINNGGTFDNNDFLTNAVTIVNLGSGTLNNNSSLANNGTLTNSASGALNNSGILTNTGSIANAGTLTNQTGGTLSSFTTFTNTGNFNNDGTFDNNGTLTSDGTIVNTGAFGVAGTVAGTGSFTQTAGSLIVNGTMTQGSLSITGGTVGGGGTINGNLAVSAGGAIGPGNSPGTLTINGDLIIDTGVLSLEQGDILNVSGLFQIGAGASVELAFDSFTSNLIDLSSFFTVSQPNFLAGFANTEFNLVTFDSAFIGEELTLDFGTESLTLTAELSASALPTPSSLPLFVSSLLAMAVLGRKRRRKTA
jgi:hypothetical protein